MKVKSDNQELRARIERAAQRLMAARETEGGRVLLDVPVSYPSGSSVVVEIEQNSDRIWVSDMGMGLVEAEMMAAQDSFQKLARTKAEEFGIGYDNSAMFVLWAPAARLEAAVVCVANASAQAAADAVRLASEAQVKRQAAAVFDRIRLVFGERKVARAVQVQGKRSAWEAHNVVLFEGARKAIFEPMTMNANSISAKFLMFSDLAEGAPQVSLNAVVDDVHRLDPKAQMVGDIANIIDLKASDEVFR
ncbi:hypothetical protein [Roseobacter sp.]|uniref:hypothetical protein n=1 Tax=Roseobacter sp. TaxID=1907202 RepID=UPI00296750CD|nr:hypothetical protein [Roseobacter sp.]MDW3181365.1 hypothetical protein [Roseobacter sp.]